jgi:hypothetical protein
MEDEKLEKENTDKDEKKKAAKKPQKRLTPAEWTDAKIKWRSGQYSLNNLAEIFDVSINGLWRRFKRNNVVRGQDADTYEAEMATRQMEDAAEAAVERDAKRRGRQNDIEDFTLEAIHGINRNIFAKVAKSAKENAPLATIMDDVKVGKEIALMLKNNIDTVKRIIGEEKIAEDELPTLRVMTLTGEDVDVIRQSQEEEAAMFGPMSGNTEDILDDMDEANEANLAP